MDKKLLVNRKPKPCALCSKITMPEVYMRVFKFLEGDSTTNLAIHRLIRQTGKSFPSSDIWKKFSFSISKTEGYYGYRQVMHHWVICGSCAANKVGSLNG